VTIVATQRFPGSAWDELPEVEHLAELVPGGQQRAPDHLIRLRARAGLHERPAAPAAPGRDVAGGVEPLQRLPHRRAADLEQVRQLPLGRELLAGHELAERDGSHEPLSDPLAGRPLGKRSKRRTERVLNVTSAHPTPPHPTRDNDPYGLKDCCLDHLRPGWSVTSRVRWRQEHAGQGPSSSGVRRRRRLGPSSPVSVRRDRV